MGDLGTLGEHVPLLPRLERAGNRRRDGGVEDT
jgi:hypothetical protein